MLVDHENRITPFGNSWKVVDNMPLGNNVFTTEAAEAIVDKLNELLGALDISWFM